MNMYLDSKLPVVHTSTLTDFAYHPKSWNTTFVFQHYD